MKDLQEMYFDSFFDRVDAGELIGVPGEVFGMEVKACRKCGCTDLHACPEGCYWVEEDLCSACAFKPCGGRKP